MARGGCGTPRLQPTAPASLEGAHGRRHRGKKKKKTNHQKKKTNCKQGFNLCSVAACTRHGVGSDCCRNLGCTTLGRAPGAARPRPLPRAGLLAEPASSRGVLGVAGSSPKDHQRSQPELISSPAARRISCAAAGKKKKKFQFLSERFGGGTCQAAAGSGAGSEKMIWCFARPELPPCLTSADQLSCFLGKDCLQSCHSHQESRSREGQS